MGIIEAAPERDKACSDCDGFLMCLMAAQCNALGNSHLSLAVKAVTEGDDEYFVHWINQ